MKTSLQTVLCAVTLAAAPAIPRLFPAPATVFRDAYAAPAVEDSGVAFRRVMEPNEGAFSILVPVGWSANGGIYRVNAAQAGGPLNALEAKADLTYMSNDEGRVMFRILPDIVYAHAGIGGGFFPPGSVYQGAVVRPYESAEQHLRTLIESLHANARDKTIVKITRLAGEIRAMEQGQAYMNALLAQVGGAQMMFEYDAAGALLEYREGGERYREVLLTGIINMRAALTWKNTRTLQFRAPVDAFDRWRAVMDIMRFSIQFNPQWILAESQGQRERADFAVKVFQEMNRIDRAIAQKTRVNYAEIMNDNFLVLTGQEEYVNPHTKEIDIDTDHYRYRWTTPGGDRYYTNDEDVDPNDFMQRTDYARTPARQRRNEPGAILNDQ